MEPQPGDFFNYQCTTYIKASPETVWKIVGDLGGAAEWAGSGQVLSIEKVDDGPPGVGTRYIAHEKIGMKFDSESVIKQYEPQRLIEWHTRPIGMPMPEGKAHRWAFRLQREGEGTRLEQELRATKAKGLPRLMQMFVTKPPFKKGMLRGIDRTMDKVKAQAESSA